MKTSYPEWAEKILKELGTHGAQKLIKELEKQMKNKK